MPAKRAASARVMPSIALAMANIRAAAARSGSRRASRRSVAADTSSRIASRLPFIVPAPSRSGRNGTRRLRVAPSHRRVSSDAGRYQTFVDEDVEAPPDVRVAPSPLVAAHRHAWHVVHQETAPLLDR